MRKSCLIAALAMLSFSVAAASKSKIPDPPPPASDPYPSTYQRIGSAPVLIRNATVLTGTGERRTHA